ncbi:hypothetical protein Y032_0097g3046 [Ancylostoma ceylanicum]|uniref:Uncharacterized protein n=1 Tax=Ancylostoma ceylanicum TaxID=53326 RepID=A0A016TJY8_9BILA|nr:hypothetical protein Y032_0097g3046 [Ancylostoma ceylanicum]
MKQPCTRRYKVLLEKLDGFRVCRIAAGPEQEIRREHALNKRVNWVPQRFCGRNASKPHTHSVYLFDKDMCVRRLFEKRRDKGAWLTSHQTEQC